MKKVDKFLVKSFIGPFIAILLVVVFILMMQFLWLYIDELVGRGLGLSVILEFLFWGVCSQALPLALPLSTLLASMMTLAFRIALYFYAFISISGTKLSKETVGPTLKKIFLNPIMIMMLLGLIIWLTQNITWQIQVDEASYGFLRIDKTAPMLFKVIEFGDVMATPLRMILIGSTLGEAKFLDAIKNKTAWILALLHTFFVPLFVFGICCALEAFGWMHFSEFQLAALVIGMTAPVSAVVVVFTVQNNKESYVASDTLFLTTLLCLIAIPAMFALVKLAMTWPLFIA